MVVVSDLRHGTEAGCAHCSGPLCCRTSSRTDCRTVARVSHDDATPATDDSRPCRAVASGRTQTIIRNLTSYDHAASANDGGVKRSARLAGAAGHANHRPI